MAINYATPIPHDKNTEPLQGWPAPVPTKQVTVAVPPAVSSVISFGANTTTIEVVALNGAMAMKWGPGSVIAAAGTANFDHVIPINTIRRFVVPQSVAGVTASVVGARDLNGLYQNMAVISISSTLSSITEY